MGLGCVELGLGLGVGLGLGLGVGPRLPVRVRRWAVAAMHGEHAAACSLQLLAQRHLCSG